MTNKERLISLVGFTPANESVEGALIDANLEGSSLYLVANSVKLKTIAIDLMELLLTTPNTSNETGYSITFDRGAVERRISRLRGEIGLVITGGSLIRSLQW